MSKTDIVKRDNEESSLIVNDGELDKFFSVEKVVKSNCKICNSEHRDVIENIYENQKRKNLSQIQRELKEKYDFDVTLPSLKSHLKNHYEVTKNNIKYLEFRTDLEKWISIQNNREMSLRARMAILEKEYHSLAQITDDLSIDERRKTLETMKKLSESILLYEKQITELQEQENPVSIIFNHLQIIINDELKNNESDQTRVTIQNIIRKLKTEIGDLEY